MSTPAPDEWKRLGADHDLLGRRVFAVDLAAGQARAEAPQRGRADAGRDAPGADRPLLMLHGFPTCGWDWAPIAEQLAQGRRVIIPDLLGFGFSEKPRGPYTIAEQADLVIALLRKLGLLDVELDLVSHDMGDTVACELLARRRASGEGPRVRKVVMLNGGLLPELHRPILTQKLLRSPLAPAVVKLMTRARFGKALASVFGPKTQPSEKELDEHFMLVSRDEGLQNYPQLIGYIAERRQHRARWMGALTNLDVPLRLVWGDVDPVAVWPIAEEIKRLRPATEVVRLEGIGHYPQLEAPQRVLEGIRAFLG